MRYLSAEMTVQKFILEIDGNYNLIELDRLTGELRTHQPVPVPEKPGKFTHTLTLPGGTGALFKIDDGTPFALLKDSD
jgi:hypothetical protein